jgi:hypothetical protein
MGQVRLSFKNEIRDCFVDSGAKEQAPESPRNDKWESAFSGRYSVTPFPNDVIASRRRRAKQSPNPLTPRKNQPMGQVCLSF